jgi:uncharacterized protein (DUF2147 family)
MKKIFWLSLLTLFVFCQAYAQENVEGFWKTVDETSGQIQSMIAIYQYQGKYYGRIIGTYDKNGRIKDSIYSPKERAPGVIGNPFYAGLDIMWDLKHKGDKYGDGKILDPRKGRIYGAEMWAQNGKLVVRGKLLIFGRNQTWLPVVANDFSTNFQKPDLKSFVPLVPKVK